MTANNAAEHYYSYDAFGDPSMDASSPRKYDGNNRIAAAAGVAYDAAGDMTRDGKHSYQFDAERRISQVDGGSAEYLYSAEGDRIEKRVGGEATETIWVGNDPITELKPDGTWVDYLYLDGRRVAAISKSDATYYVADPLGMTRMELSSTGDILAQSDMTPFGQLINRRSDADEVPFTGGEQYDAESGLYSYKYRSYNPQLGRWMSPDPSDEEFARVSNPQSLNLYSYVINDPLKFVDQLGLQAAGSTCTATPQQNGSGTAGTIYNETSTLREDGKTVGPNLHNARVAIAQVIDVNHSTAKVASPTVQDNLNYPPAGAAMKDSQAAVSEELTAPNGTQGATHFFLAGGNTPTPAWVSQGKVVESFGPFPVAANTHDFSKGQSATIQIIQYPVPQQ